MIIPPLLKNAIDKSYHTKIKANKALCLKCETVIESTHRHDFKFCKCESVAVDGGTDYLKRAGSYLDCKELSEFVYCPEERCDGKIVYACVSFTDFSDNGWYCQKCYKKY